MPDTPHDKIVKKAMRLARSDMPSLVASTSPTGNTPAYQKHADLQTRILRLLPNFGAGVLQRPNIYAGVEHREDAATFCLDMYEGRQIAYLDKMPEESPGDFEDRRGKVTLKLTSAVIDTLARLYDETPKRTTEDEEYLSWIAQHAVDALLQCGERLTTLQGNGALRMLYSEERGIYPEWLTSDQIRTVPNPEDLANPLAVIVRWIVDDLSEAKTIRYATVYTRDEIIPLKDYEPDKEAIAASGLPPGPSGMGVANPYKAIINGKERGVIPLALARYRLVGKDWHVDGEGQFVADWNAEINNVYSAVMNQAYMQGFTPVVMQGRDTKQPLVWGPGAIIDLRANKNEVAGVQTVQLDSHIMELLELISQTINHGLRSLRIPESALHATADASGVSITVANTPLAEFRKGSIPRWQQFERAAHTAWAAVNAYHFNGPVPNADEDDLAVSWPEPSATVTPESRATDEDRRMSLGLLSVVDIELSENADAYNHIDDEPKKRAAAMKQLQDRKAENEKLNPPPMQALGPDGEVIEVPGKSAEPDDADTAPSEPASDPADAGGDGPPPAE